MCGENHINIQLYNRLLEKTTLTNTTSIEKHISIFKEFCVSNNESIINRNYNEFESEGVNFSDNIYINFKNVFEEGNEEDCDRLWGMLNNFAKKTKPRDNNFLANLMGKIEGSVDVNTSNPMEAITSMMSSGVFTDLVGTMTSGLSNGDITLGSLFGQMNDLAGNLGDGQDTTASTRGLSRPKRNRKKKKPKRK
jgi:hypothetical protein